MAGRITAQVPGLPVLFLYSINLCYFLCEKYFMHVSSPLFSSKIIIKSIFKFNKYRTCAESHCSPRHCWGQAEQCWLLPEGGPQELREDQRGRSRQRKAANVDRMKHLLTGKSVEEQMSQTVLVQVEIQSSPSF